MFAQQNDGQSDTVSTEQTGIAIKEQIKGFSDTHIEQEGMTMKGFKFPKLLLLLIFVIVIGVEITQLGYTAIDAAKLFRDASPSVGLVMALDANRQPLALGSGFFVDTSGTFATNFHVIEGAAFVRVKLPSGSLYEIRNVAGYDTTQDLALLITVAKGVSPLPLAKSKVEIGEDIMAIGNPLGLEGTISTGVISGIRTFNDGFQLYQITAPISAGSSGGPVLNRSGEVVGVATSSLELGQNLNFAVPKQALKSLLLERAWKTPITLGQATGQRMPERKNLTRTAIKCINPSITSYMNSLTFSVVNEGNMPVKNITLLAVYYREKREIKGSEDPLHFTPIKVEKTIPPGLAVRVKVFDEALSNWFTEFRVLDWEVIKTEAAVLQFRIAK